MRYHYVREKVADGAILVQYIPTEKQIADYFTNALPEEKFKDFVKASGVFLGQVLSLHLYQQRTTGSRKLRVSGDVVISK